MINEPVYLRADQGQMASPFSTQQDPKGPEDWKPGCSSNASSGSLIQKDPASFDLLSEEDRLPLARSQAYRASRHFA